MEAIPSLARPAKSNNPAYPAFPVNFPMPRFDA
jgi:hypothetical protein